MYDKTIDRETQLESQLTKTKTSNFSKLERIKISGEKNEEENKNQWIKGV